MTDKLDTLRPEVRDALQCCDRDLPFDIDGAPTAWQTIRTELLRLAGECAMIPRAQLLANFAAANERAEKAESEVAYLRSVCAAAYQAAGCYGLPERFKDALSNGASGARIHDVDVNHLLPVYPTDWVERAERAEAELAALKARIAGACCVPLTKVALGNGYSLAVSASMSVNDVDDLCGKRARLVMEE